MKNILITGGTGYIGKRLVAYLSKKGFNIIVLTSNKKKYETKNKITYHKFDILCDSVNTLKKIIKRVDTIIHLAWYVNPKDYLNSKKKFLFLSFYMSISRVK